jgi:teichuronic acid biosynthesis glycosyltransferase TuaH
MTPRLALVSHVDWGHIRQRPHQLAAALSVHYRVTVASPVSRNRRNLVDNPRGGIALARVFRLPGSYRSVAALRINAMLARAQLSAWLDAADIVVVTSPELWPWVERGLGERTLVYDCMDDALAFEQDAAVRDAKAKWERELLARADVVSCSSDELVARCRSRGADAGRVACVPNGWDPDAFPVQPTSPLPAHGPIELVYFGTIARWLDVDALRRVVDACPDVTVRLIGPNEGIDLDGIARVTIDAPKRHAELAAAVAGTHALLLPFRVDALTRAVDPVKLYEYVALGKPVLAARWPAIDRFAPFVTFYRDAEHLAELLATRHVGPPPSLNERRAFLEPQTWAARAEQLRAAIEMRGTA